MTITRADVADLREGDVVEVHRPDWPDGTTLRGPLHERSDRILYLADEPVRWSGDDDKRYAWMTREGATLTVISRAPRLYVNHDRTEPVPGDVVRDADSDDRRTWMRNGWRAGGLQWIRTTGGLPRDAETFIDAYERREHLPARLRLLVDGETGQVVP